MARPSRQRSRRMRGRTMRAELDWRAGRGGAGFGVLTLAVEPEPGNVVADARAGAAGCWTRSAAGGWASSWMPRTCCRPHAMAQAGRPSSPRRRTCSAATCCSSTAKDVDRAKGGSVPAGLRARSTCRRSWAGSEGDGIRWGALVGHGFERGRGSRPSRAYLSGPDRRRIGPMSAGAVFATD